MNAVMTPLAAGHRPQERRAAPVAVPPISRADRIIAEGDRKRHAYRCLYPNADTGMVYSAQIGHLHGEVRRLCNELETLNIVRDATLDYLTVDSADFAVPLVVGFAYERGSPARVTSGYTYAQTGDPGDPGEPDELEVMEVWVNGVDVAHVLTNEATEAISSALLTKIHALQAKGREQDGEQ